MPVMVQVVERVGDKHFRAGTCTVNGYRESNEDAHATILRPDGGFFGVFDGHGGQDCSAYIARRFGEKIKALDKLEYCGDSNLSTICVDLDWEYLYPKADEFRPASAAGSTGTFLLAKRLSGRDNADTAGNKESDCFRFSLLVGNVGDSRVLLWDGAEFKAMTTDHKPDLDRERARIEQFGGRVQNGRVDGNLAVSRAFGDCMFKTVRSKDPYEQKVIAVPDVTTATVPWNKGAFAVLCCDGVFESNFSNEQVIEFIRTQMIQTKDLAVIAGRVCHEAVARGSRDNVTCMIVEFADGSDLPPVPALDAFPGPFHCPFDHRFRRLYRECALSANVPVEILLERRYDELLRLGEERSKSEQAEFIAFRNAETGSAPPTVGTSEAAARTNWFADYFAHLGRVGLDGKIIGPPPSSSDAHRQAQSLGHLQTQHHHHPPAAAPAPSGTSNSLQRRTEEAAPVVPARGDAGMERTVLPSAPLVPAREQLALRLVDMFQLSRQRVNDILDICNDDANLATDMCIAQK